jgi:serine/threonine protein kinase
VLPHEAIVELGIDGLSDAVEVGRGGFGIVYAANERATGRRVAVKVLAAVAALRQQARFEAECHAMSTLSAHPNIAGVHKWGHTAEMRPYLCMEYLPGGSLAERLRRDGPSPPESARRVGEQVAMALAAAHDAGIIHRDVKPENILLAEDGRAVLTDFGIASVTGMTSSTTGPLVASLAHVAPELLDGQRATPLVDIYGLGSTLFTLLTGRPAFVVDGEPPARLLTRLLEGDLPDLEQSGVPRDLAGIVRRAMARRPELRTSNAHKLAAELRARPSGSTARLDAIGPTRTQGEPPPTPTHSRAWLIGAAAVVTLALLALFFAVGGRRHGNALQTDPRVTATPPPPPSASPATRGQAPGTPEAGTTSAAPTPQRASLRAIDWTNRPYPSDCATFGNSIQQVKLTNSKHTDDSQGYVSVSIGEPVYGDLDGDGQDEAALVLRCEHAASTWHDTVLVYRALGNEARLIRALGASIGSSPEFGSTVQSVHIAGKQLRISAKDYSDSAPRCCPDLTVSTTWRMTDGELLRTSRSSAHSDDFSSG